ncbi:toast rack family protein [Acidobacteriota bacterium]
MMKYVSLKKIFFLAILMSGAVVCVKVGSFEEETKIIPLSDIESVKVEIEMGAGELKIMGGTEQLFEGYFRYNVERWKPRVDYNVSGSKGRITVRQGDKSGVPMGRARNIWIIDLNDNIPTEIAVDFGAGEGKIDLRGILLRSVDIDMGVGDLTVDLSGERTNDLEVEINGGVGSATIYLPEDVGVSVDVDGGIGSVDALSFHKEGHVYTNDAFGNTNVSIYVKIEAGIGSIDLKMK